jgi:glucose dehydrogenase
MSHGTMLPSQRRWMAAALLCAFPALLAAQKSATKDTMWAEYGGSPAANQYSPLAQVNRTNVAQLQPVWTFSTGDDNAYSFNPLVADGVMYVEAHHDAIVALDPTTGKELWSTPTGTGVHSRVFTSRGLNYWKSADGREARLLYSLDNTLHALDSKTGKPIMDFGSNGSVDLRADLGRDPASLTLVQSYNPGKVFEDLLILGSATNEEYNSGPGDIRAYNVRTGKLVWTFHTVPHPGEAGYETWPPDAWKTVGGANSWVESALDVKRGIIFVPTASPKYNFYGANRKGANLFGDSLLALNARTGKLIWYFQMVHHDIWDYDNGTTPMLMTIKHDGKPVDVVAQPNKEGYVWVFNRETGKPIWPIKEVPQMKSDMPGEETSPTQPIPSAPPPFGRQTFTADDLSPYLEPEERKALYERISKARNNGMFTPPSTQDVVQMPGNNGGSNFGSAASDPTNGELFVMSKDYPAILKLSLTTKPGDPPPDMSDPTKLQYKSSFGFINGKNGLSAIAPPWTTLTAYDLNTGRIKWKEPVGEVPELAAKGIHDTGAQMPKTGPVVTAGGLIFTGTHDRKVRALDRETGKILWEATLDASLEGMPAIYEIGGKQYIVFCAAGPALRGTAQGEKPAGAYVAFALPSK